MDTTDRMRWFVDARLLVKHYRAELYRGNQLVWQSTKTYDTVEEATDAARRQIRFFATKVA